MAPTRGPAGAPADAVRGTRRGDLLLPVSLVLVVVLLLAPGPISLSPPSVSRGLSPSVAPASGPAYGPWTNVTGQSGVPPSCRNGEGLAYDTSLGALVLFGGLQGCGANPTLTSVENDTWEYTNGTWTNLTATLTTAPPASFGMTFVYDPVDQEIVEFGGSDTVGRVNSQTWVFNGTWRNLTAALTVAPAARYDAGATYDTTNSSVLMFGGQSGFFARVQLYNDTWTFAGNRWTNRSTTVAPPGLRSPSLTFDGATNRSILFGGAAAAYTSNATWSYSNGTWTNLSLRSHPFDRYAQAAAFDPTDGAIILFGGIFADGSEPNDTWAFSNGTWTNVSAVSGTPPPGLGLARLAWEPSVRILVLFGGSLANSDRLPITWTYGVPTFLLQSVRWTPPAIDQGHSSTLIVTSAGGFGPYTYNYTGLPNGCPATSTGSVPCSPAVNGTFNVTVRVTDGNGSVAQSNATLVVHPAFFASLNASATELEVNSSLRLTSGYQGGAGGVRYAYLGLPSGCRSADVAVLACAPNATGNSTVQVEETDALGVVASSPSRNVAVFGPFAVVVRSSLAVGEVGRPVWLNATDAGAAPPPSFVWSGLPTGCAPFDSASLLCLPTGNGSFQPTVDVTDHLGTLESGSTAVSIHPALAAVPVLSSRTLEVGDVLVVRAVLTGGVGTTATLWTASIPGCTLRGGSSSCAPTTPGNYTIQVSATDSLGAQSTGSAVLAVVARLTGASITVDAATNCSAPYWTTFAVATTGGDGPDAYAWTFGDGATGTAGPSTGHAYALTGNYSVTVTVKDALGVTTGQSITTNVEPGAACPGVSGSGGGPPSPSTVLLVGTIVLVVAVAGAIGTILVRRRGRGGAAADEPAEAGSDPGFDGPAPYDGPSPPAP